MKLTKERLELELQRAADGKPRGYAVKDAPVIGRLQNAAGQRCIMGEVLFGLGMEDGHYALDDATGWISFPFMDVGRLAHDAMKLNDDGVPWDEIARRLVPQPKPEPVSVPEAAQLETVEVA